MNRERASEELHLFALGIQEGDRTVSYEAALGLAVKMNPRTAAIWSHGYDPYPNDEKYDRELKRMANEFAARRYSRRAQDLEHEFRKCVSEARDGLDKIRCYF